MEQRGKHDVECRSCEHTLMYYNTDYRLEHWMCGLDIDIDTTNFTYFCGFRELCSKINLKTDNIMRLRYIYCVLLKVIS